MGAGRHVTTNNFNYIFSHELTLLITSLNLQDEAVTQEIKMRGRIHMLLSTSTEFLPVRMMTLLSRPEVLCYKWRTDSLHRTGFQYFSLHIPRSAAG